jgi:hypothetical protein
MMAGSMLAVSVLHTLAVPDSMSELLLDNFTLRLLSPILSTSFSSSPAEISLLVLASSTSFIRMNINFVLLLAQFQAVIAFCCFLSGTRPFTKMIPFSSRENFSVK